MFGKNIIYDAQWQVTLTLTLNSDKIMAVLVTCKNEEDSSKNEGTREVTTILPL